METKKEMTVNSPMLETLYNAGAHFAFTRSRRHPSAAPFIYGIKNKVEIFDLQKTLTELAKAKEFIRKYGTEGKTILFVGGKNEARAAVKEVASALNMPYVFGRWIGGTITNFTNIRARVEKYLDFVSKREKGELSKYTKKERLVIDREIAKLEEHFSGILAMKELPKALFVIDSRREKIAVAEAKKAGIPVVSLSGSDNDMKEVNIAIPANDSSIPSIKLILSEIATAYREGKSVKPATVA
jgi:small subunit ribosomal protein S2